MSVFPSIFFYIALGLLAFFPCLFQGQAYFDNDLMAQFGPWRAFLKNELAQGHFPLWNPYLMGGTPFFADPQNMMLYPLNWLTLPFSVPMGLTVFFFLHMVLAAVGMHLWLRSLGLSKNACRAGAILFSLSGFFWLEIIHPPVLAAFAWLPWVFGGLERLAKNPKPLNAFGAGFCFAMLFLCGSFQVTIGAFYGGLAYFLFRYYKVGPRLTLRACLPLILLFLWGALPLLGQLIPTYEFANLSDRATPGAQSEKLNSQLSLNPATLGQFLFPRMTLKEGEDMAVALQSDKDAPNFPLAANWGYLGIWLPFLVWGAWRGKDKSQAAFFSVFAILALIFCFGHFTPFHALVNNLLPGLSLIRVPYRFLYLYVLVASVLAAMGWNHLIKPNPNDGKNQVLRYFGLFAIILFVVGLFKMRQSIVEVLSFIIGSIGLSYFFQLHWRRAGSLWFFVALTFPLLFNGWGDFEKGPSTNFNFDRGSRAVMAAADSVKPGRLIFMTNEMYYPIEVGGKKYALNYPQNAACALGIKNFGGYNPLVLQTKRDIGNLPMATAMQLGAVGGILTQADHGPMPGFKKEAYPPYLLYRRPGTPALALGAVNVQCRLEKEGTEEQNFSVDIPKAGQVAFTETMYPGWKAWVDGQPAPLKADPTFQLLRSLLLTPGHHEVEFKFEPEWWTPIRIGLVLWLFATLAALLILMRRNFFAILQALYYSIGGHGLGRIKVLRWAYDTLFRLFKPKCVMVQGHRMWLDDKDTLELAVHEVYEPVETTLLKKLLQPGQTFVDVGANIGYYTLLAARIVGPKGKVYAFEPDLTNFTLLKKNITANGYTNVVAVNQALSSKTGKAKLYLSPSNRGDHRIYDSHDGRPSVEIQAASLDGYFKKLDKKVHFIKMDVQGAEAAALAGMKGLIRKNRGLKLVTEFSPGALKAFGADPKKYLKDLQALGFRFLEISEKNKSVKPVTPAQLMKRKWGGGEDYTNLFCIKK